MYEDWLNNDKRIIGYYFKRYFGTHVSHFNSLQIYPGRNNLKFKTYDIEINLPIPLKIYQPSVDFRRLMDVSCSHIIVKQILQGQFERNVLYLKS